MKPRLYHFDILKGIAIFMVVMGHTLILCMDNMRDCVPARLIAGIHMPLFFFISGWFTAKVDADGRLRAPDLKRRFIQLIVPTAVTGSLYFLVIPSLGLVKEDVTFQQFWLSSGKMGYWFGICLFEIMVVYSLLLPLLRRARKATATLAVGLGACVILMGISSAAKTVTTPLEVLEVGCYLFPFMVGVVASRHREGFNRLIENNVAMTAAILVLCACLCVQVYQNEVRYLTIIIVRLISHVPLAMIAKAVFKPWSDRQYSRTEGPGSAARTWTYLGRNSFAIYLLHYFFLFPLQQVETWIGPLCPGFVPLALTAAVIAAMVTACVCGLIELLKPSRVLSKILTGA